MKSIIIILLAFITASCAVTSYDVLSEVEDQPPMFKQGYIDGCESGYEAGGSMMTEFKRGEEYVSIDLYRQGWDEGFNTCRNQLDQERDLERIMKHR